MLYVFEMANNHQGSLEHALRIIDEFSLLAKKNKINAAIKFQFRQLNTFIHDDFKNSDYEIYLPSIKNDLIYLMVNKKILKKMNEI